MRSQTSVSQGLSALDLCLAESVFVLAWAELFKLRVGPMSDRKRSLTELCGGRFGIVPAAVSDSPDVQNGPLRLYVIMCARAKPKGTCEIRLKYIAKMLGVSVRTVQAWKRELELLGWLQQLHQGDKAIGTFRVIRDPSERNHVRFSNAIKVGIRSAAKTPHATKTSHPRCEGNCTYNKKEGMTSLNLPAEPAAEGSSPALDPKQARQGNAMATGFGSKPPTPRKLNQKTPARQPDWQFWVRWIAATRPMNKEEACLWLMAEIGRLAEEHAISPEDAGWMLHHRLRSEKESGE